MFPLFRFLTLFLHQLPGRHSNKSGGSQDECTDEAYSMLTDLGFIRRVRPIMMRGAGVNIIECHGLAKSAPILYLNSFLFL
jgi:hypothetical protein